MKIYEHEFKQIKKAAIFTRLSNPELSLETCQRHAVEKGYTVTHVLTTVCGGLELSDNPQYKYLWKLMTDQSINAVVIADRDSLFTDPKQRIKFILDCHEFEIEIIIADGSPSICHEWDELNKLVRSRPDLAKKMITAALRGKLK